MRVETLLEHLEVLSRALIDILETIDADEDTPARDIKDALEQANDFVGEITLKFCTKEDME